MHTNKLNLYLITVISCLLLAVGCGFNTSPERCNIYPMRDETVVLFPPGTSEQKVRSQLNTISNTLETIYRKLSLDIHDSEVNTINRIGHTVRIPITRETYNILQLTKNFNDLTSNVFDITMLPVAYLWGFHGGNQPKTELSPDILRAAMDSAGFKNVQIYKNAIELRSPYTRISFDELVQAYAIDLAILKLRRLEYYDVYISMDGMARCLGRLSRTHPWTYPLNDPFSLQPFGYVELDTLPAAATAQTGQDYVVIAGEKYSHIIDPRTGIPVQHTASVTVLAPSTTKAAALARALYISGVDGATEMLKEFPRCEALIIPARPPLTLYMTHGFAEHLFIPTDQDIDQHIISTLPSI